MMALSLALYWSFLVIVLLHLVSGQQLILGKRMFKRWICHPLRNIEKINERLDAIEALNFLGLEQGS
jgi:DNA mismatch repair ATPase MutS